MKDKADHISLLYVLFTQYNQNIVYSCHLEYI